MKRVLLCAALIAWSGVASAVVYRWVDAQGKLQYGDRPPDGVHAELVEMVGNRAATRIASTPSTGVSSPAKVAGNAAGDSVPKDDAVKKEVATDVAQEREKQCAEAQDVYKKLIEGRRIYKTGADGERQYLTSEEIDSQRVNAKRDLDAVCKDPQ